MPELEDIIDQNISLKKAVYLHRNKQEKIEKQLTEANFLLEESQKRCSQLSRDHCNLQKKYQNSFAESTKASTSLVAQIEELKDLLEEKQRQIENFQIKMIPSLDQDMLRVKLITEMEAPYQQNIEKKQIQIEKLKEKLAKAQRKIELLELQMRTKLGEAKRDLQQCKTYYTAENQRLMREITNITEKRTSKTVDWERFKGQRKQIQSLKSALQFEKDSFLEMQTQISTLKSQKEQILLQMANINEQNALKLHLSPDSSEIKKYKEQKGYLEEEIHNKETELDKIKKFVKQLENENRRMEEDSRKQQIMLRDGHDQEKATLKEEIHNLKDQLRKMRDGKERMEAVCLQHTQKLQSMEKELKSAKRQCESLQMEVSLKNEAMEKEKRKQNNVEAARTQIRKPVVQPSPPKKQNEEIHMNQSTKEAAYVHGLESKIGKLKQKLEQANRKIVELIKQKAQLSGKGRQDGLMRPRAASQIEPDRKRYIVLENRDTAFNPLIPPAVFAHNVKTRYI